MTPASDKHCHRPRTSDDRDAALQARVRNLTGQPEEFEYKGTFHAPLGMVNGVTTFGFGEIAVSQNGTSHSWGILNIPQLKTAPELRTMIRPGLDNRWDWTMELDWHY